MALLFSSSWFYHGLMTVMYHVHVRERFREVARWIPPRARICLTCAPAMRRLGRTAVFRLR
ncbi:MAG: hypothetical protein ACREWG_05800 [Gammaproteobacteria bacterium]